jgi:nucleoside-diphosphate-sugar epimerase
LLGAARGSWGRSPHQFPAVILRVAGIYGPGRGHWFKQFLRGEARLEGDGSRWLNMIHRDDLIGVITAALEHGTPGQIYNATDNEPVTQLELFKWLAEKINRPMPPNVPADAELWRQRGVTNKRVSNAKLVSELIYRFRYPDFRSGYAAEIARLAEEGFPV